MVMRFSSFPALMALNWNLWSTQKSLIRKKKSAGFEPALADYCCRIEPAELLTTFENFVFNNISNDLHFNRIKIYVLSPFEVKGLILRIFLLKR